MHERLKEIWPRGDAAADEFLFAQGAMMRAAKAAVHRRVGISASRLSVLASLYVSGELSQADLQRRLAVDPAAVTRQVKQLEAEGLVSRRDDPADNRFTLVTLTAEGTERLRDAARKVREFGIQSLEGVSPEELACMQRAMARVRANLEKM